MFSNVIKAIIDLKSDEGVTINSISEQLRCYIRDPKEQKKDCQFLAQVRRALRHGLRAGIIVRDGKKYKLELIGNNCRPKEQCMEEPMEVCNDTPVISKPIKSVSEIINVLPEMKPSTIEERAEKPADKHFRKRRDPRRNYSLKRLDSKTASNAFCNFRMMLNS